MARLLAESDGGVIFRWFVIFEGFLLTVFALGDNFSIKQSFN